MDMWRNRRSIVAGIGIVVMVLTGTGCVAPEPVALTLVAGDILTIRQTVFGIGGKIAEFFGKESEEQIVIVPAVWPTTSTTYGTDTFVLLPKEKYQELMNGGKTQIGLGLFDSEISDVLSFADRLDSLLALIGQPPTDLPEGEDVLTVTVTDTDSKDWIRLNGELAQVKTIEASNWFASYVILANADSPIILSLTLKPAARAKFDALASFEGFEVSEITQVSPPSEDQPQP